MLGAFLFSRIQATGFYRRLHEEAVHILPPGEGRLWVDVGCGPGLVSRIAASRGYQAIGIDADDAMVRQARFEARRGDSTATFMHVSLECMHRLPAKADVVSATSLLSVLRDPRGAVGTLLSATRENGTLLIVEPSEQMTSKNAQIVRARRKLGVDGLVLQMWASTRSPGDSIGWETLRIPGYSTRRHDLLDGLVSAWTIAR